MYVLWGHCNPPQHTATRRNTPHRASLQHTATSCTAEFVSKEQLMRKYLMYVIFKIARILLDTHTEIKHMCSAQMRTQYKIDFKTTFLFTKKWCVSVLLGAFQMFVYSYCVSVPPNEIRRWWKSNYEYQLTNIEWGIKWWCKSNDENHGRNKYISLSDRE